MTNPENPWEGRETRSTENKKLFEKQRRKEIQKDKDKKVRERQKRGQNNVAQNPTPYFKG